MYRHVNMPVDQNQEDDELGTINISQTIRDGRIPR